MSRKLEVNPITCVGHGICAELFPERITLDPWGYPIIDPKPIPQRLEPHARRAVSACPTLALLWREGRGACPALRGTDPEGAVVSPRGRARCFVGFSESAQLERIHLENIFRPGNDQYTPDLLFQDRKLRNKRMSERGASSANNKAGTNRTGNLISASITLSTHGAFRAAAGTGRRNSRQRRCRIRVIGLWLDEKTCENKKSIIQHPAGISVWPNAAITWGQIEDPPAYCLTVEKLSAWKFLPEPGRGKIRELSWRNQPDLQLSFWLGTDGHDVSRHDAAVHAVSVKRS